MATLEPKKQSVRWMNSSVAVLGILRPSAILSAAAVLLLLCPLSLRAQDFGTTMAAPMGQLPQMAIGQEFGPDGQPINPDSSSDYQSPDDSNGDSNASSDDNDDNSDDNADSNSDSDDNNNDNAQSGNDDNSGQTQQPESN